jgi:hypothetical protein
MGFLLQSCCFGPGIFLASKKPCNCKDDKPVYASVPNSSVTNQDDKIASTHIRDLRDNTSKTEPVFNMVKSGDMSKTSSYAFTQNENAVQGISFTTTEMTKKDNKKNVRSFEEKQLPLGIKSVRTHIIAGPNVSFKSSKEDYGSSKHKHKPGIGVQFGVGSTWAFSDRFAVNTALLFKHNTSTEELTYSTGETTGGGGGSYSQESESKYSYSYLSAPITAEVKIAEQLSAFAGPEINFLLGSSVKSKGNGDDEKTSLTKSSVKLGVGVQAGLKYGIPGSPIAVQLVYDHRISRLNKKNSEYTGGGGYETPAWHMKSVQLSVVCAICELLKKK